MIKKILILPFITVLPSLAWGACTGSSPTWTTTPDYTSVASCISGATAEDTITVSAGSATWSTTLSIDEGIDLIASGTVTITAGVNPLIRYAPSAATGANDYAFRVSGFTFTLGSNTAIGLCGNTSGDAACSSSNNMGAIAQTKIRIDNSSFTGSSQAIFVQGAFRGVVYKNTFDGFSSPMRHKGTGTGSADWSAFGAYDYGSADNLYYEDNTFVNVGGYMISDCYQAGRYAYRYNDISTDGNLTPLWDYHGGDKGNGVWGCFSGEIYGNDIDANNNGAYFTGQRSAKLLGFYNNLANSTSTNGGQWYVYDGGTSGDPCPPAQNYNDQLIQDNYFWGSRHGVTGSLADAVGGNNTCGDVVEGTTFLDDSDSSGVRCGTLGNLPSTCTTGMGYWATDQSCSDLTGMIGASPTTPISGTLYKCTSTDTWEPYYTPYTYPHPLRENL